MIIARRYLFPIVAMITGLVAGCGNPTKPGVETAPSSTSSRTITIQPGPNVQEELQTALIKARPGDTIELADGIFEFTKELSLAVERVTLRGRGMEKTVLSFKDQIAGKEGLLVTRGKFRIEDLTIENTKGDALKINDCEDVIVRRVQARWTGEPKETNGAYGIYPVLCKNVLIDGCVAIGASDAGIYVGQSQNVIVRRCKAMHNVAGIEIENCIDADVYDNIATSNTGGLLVFDLPGLQVKNGKRVRVHDNQIVNNNHRNFAPAGNMVASVAPGTGMMVMATDQVELFGNTLKDHDTYGLLIVSFTNLGKPVDDKEYDPYPEGVHVHDNTFVNCGAQPRGDLANHLAQLLGKPFPDILCDGEVNPARLVGGKLPPEFGLAIKNNGKARFASLGRNALKLLDPSRGIPKVERDLAPYERELPALPAVKLPGDEG